MRKVIIPALIFSCLAAGCNPSEYQVNPPKSESSRQEEESKRQGYMRILGGLRWDELTSNPEWRERFSCLMNSEKSPQVVRFYPKNSQHIPFRGGGSGWYAYFIDKVNQGDFADWVRERRGPGDFLSNSGYILADSPYGKWAKPVTPDCNYEVGGIPLNPKTIYFGSNSGTESKFMTTSVTFSFPDDSQSRAFKSAVVDKYQLTTGGYCSKYTCWTLGDIDTAGEIAASPTPYTVSILDQVKINTSEL